MADQIIAEIRYAIPEYARPMDGPYGHALSAGVWLALTAFVEAIAHPSAPREHLDEVCRKLGLSEAREGRSLDSLQAAYRIGARVAWHRVMQLGRAHRLSSLTVSLLADAVFHYMDELASLSEQGYEEEKARSAGTRLQWRRRLLRLILERPPAPRQAIDELAGQAGWIVPDELTLIAVAARPQPPPALPDDDMLTDLRGPHPHLLVPGPLDESRRAKLEEALHGHPAAAGLTVPLAGAADSLRWARQTLALAESGIISGGVTLAEDHMLTLWLLADCPLVDQLANQQFAALTRLTGLQQDRLMRTLDVWLECRGNATEMAGRLRVHPQTVRYRLRRLERMLGGTLDDPGARFGIEIVRRAMYLRKQASARNPGVAVGDGA